MELGITKTIKMDEILFNESARGRVDYGNIQELAQSIKEHGLINPLTVYSHTISPPYELLAGGRRYKALKLLGATLVSVRIYDIVLTDKEKRIIELYENLKRKDLSFLEQANMMNSIHETLQALHGSASPGPGKEGQSTRDTAKFLNVSQQTLNNAIKLAKVNTQFPELRLGEKKNAAAALHTIGRVEHAISSRISNPKITENSLAESYRIGDFLHSQLPVGSFDFIEVDPPYGIDLNRGKEFINERDSQGYNEIQGETYEGFTQYYIEKCTTLAREDAHIIIWTPFDRYDLVQKTLQYYGWSPSTIPAIWVKLGSTGQTLQPRYNLASVYEQFIYARRGNARIVHEGRINAFSYQVVLPSKKVHPTQRPIELIKEIIQTFCLPGANILVPFAGSGVTLAAAYDLNCSVIGYDLNEAFKSDFISTFVEERMK